MASQKKKIILKTKKDKEKNSNKSKHEARHEGRNEARHESTNKYTKYYPSILDPNFSNKIASHSIFKKYKLKTNPEKIKALYNAFETNKSMTSDDSKNKMSNIYILKSTQKLLRNFMSPYTPYRGLLIYHEMGVGKTCTAITIAESLKNIVKLFQNDKKFALLLKNQVVLSYIYFNSEKLICFLYCLMCL